MIARAGQECCACGMTGDVFTVSVTTEAMTRLGYECGCLETFIGVMAKGTSWTEAATWAKQRREGGR